jgi:UrcA family protein
MRASILSLPIALFCLMPLSLAASSPPLDEQSYRVDIIGSITLPYHDLDLRKASEARKLLTRLEQAAVRACGGNPMWHPMYQLAPEHTVAVFKECRRDAVARAVERIGEPTLTQAFAAASAGT